MPKPEIFFIPISRGSPRPAPRAHRAAPRRKKAAARSRPTAAAAVGWLLAVIDQEPIRRAATLGYRQANEQVADLRLKVQHHATMDQPAYGGWLAAAFGPLLTELREVEERIDDQGAMLRAVRMLVMLGGLSPHRAYQEILQEKAEMDRFEARVAAGEEEFEDEADAFSDDDEDLLKGMPDALRQMFGFPPGEDDPGKSSPDAGEQKDPRHGADRPRPRTRPTAKPTVAAQSAAQRLKTAYRAVVRRLHPDLRADLTDYDRQLWHEAQNAYEKGDLERLETVMALSEMGGDGVLPAGSGVAGLLALTRQLERAASQLQRQLRAFKKTPAWDFTRLAAAEKRKMERKASADLHADLADAKAALAQIEADLAACAQPPRRSKGGQRTKGGQKTRRKKK